MSAQNSAAEDTVHQVRMGELKVGGTTDAFRSLLGSCIGLAVYDPRAGFGGLAHVVLPSSTGHEGAMGKFADTAIVELIGQLEANGGRRSRMVAKFAGGARMFHTNAESTIGDQNIEAVYAGLATRQIPVLATDCGGTSGRRMMFQVATGRVVIEAVGSEAREL